MILRRAIGIATANVDGVLLGMLGLLLGIGITVLYSAANESMARVICCVDFTDRMRRRRSLMLLPMVRPALPYFAAGAAARNDSRCSRRSASSAAVISFVSSFFVRSSSRKADCDASRYSYSERS